MGDMNIEKAEATLAHDWMESAVTAFVEQGWENNPDIGEHSFERIADRMLVLGHSYVARSQVVEAYEFLAALASLPYPSEIGDYRLQATRLNADSPWEYEWVRE